MEQDRVISSSPQKDLSLEAVRGVASIVVFVWHFFIAFDHVFLFHPVTGLVGYPFYAFFHGTAAVDLFFVLSGYVLTCRFFQTGREQILLSGAFKRYFRLVFLTLSGVMLSWVFYRFSLYAYEEAARLTGSDWLALCGGAIYPPVDPPFADALWQGLVGALFFGDANFNSNLWTLHIEFFGSFFAFAFAYGLARLPRELPVLWCYCLVIGLGAALVNLHYLAFVVGVVLAFAFGKGFKLPWKAGLALFVAGLFLMGYRGPFGAYFLFEPLAQFPRDSVYSLLSIAGSGALIAACVGWPALHRSMQGPVSAFLGRISFPLYVVHIPLICSLGAATYVFSRSLAVTALAVVPVALLLASVLAVADAQWMRAVNKGTEGLMRRLRQTMPARNRS
jgi:peptidoglycan/LPS O-acetylase OafA/YrhL